MSLLFSGLQLNSSLLSAYDSDSHKIKNCYHTKDKNIILASPIVFGHIIIEYCSQLIYTTSKGRIIFGKKDRAKRSAGNVLVIYNFHVYDGHQILLKITFFVLFIYKIPQNL